MSWSAKIIETDTHGAITSEADFEDMIDNFKISQTLGDEYFVQSGDITFRHANPLPYSGDKNWLLVYYNDVLIDAFYFNYYWSSRNYKDALPYKSTLKPIQGVFYSSLKSRIISPYAGSWDWSYQMSLGVAGSAEVEIEKIRTKAYPSGADMWTCDRVGYSIGDILTSMRKGNDYYYVDAVTFPECNQLISDDLPVIFRGISLDIGNTIIDKMNWTFFDFQVTWLDIFKMAIFGWNSFVKTKPKILDVSGTDYLSIDVELLPKNVRSSYSSISPQWIDYTITPKQYQLNGIRLASTYTDEDGNPSFLYEQGDLDSKNILEREVDIADPDNYLPAYYDASDNQILYWCVGDLVSLLQNPPLYKILDGSDNNRPYFASGLVEPFYADMITSGEGIKGSIVYDGEQTGDVVLAGSNMYFQLNKVSIKKTKAGNATAEIEGVRIA